MLFYTYLLILISICQQFTLVHCRLNDIHLKVHKVDESLTKKLRQETLDMCKLYNEHHKAKTTSKKPVHPRRRRAKRDLNNNIDDDVNEVEARRVENIVDRLYDDVSGEVKYRRRNIGGDDLKVNDTRRFNFAPHLLEGPDMVTVEHSNTPGDFYVRPWIKRWAQGVIPYFIDPSTYDDVLTEVITSAFVYFKKSTCIRLQRLRELPTDAESLANIEWLYISNPSGVRQCVHSNEQKPNKGMQTIVFGYNCMSKGEIVHELMHVLGFSHEHTRPDRDKYVTILWDNIKPGYKKFFVKKETDSLSNIPYDYASVMHYPSRAFSKNGQLTIIPNSGVKIGQRDGLSEYDVEKVAHVYGYDCMKRNDQYLAQTCPNALQTVSEAPVEVDQDQINDYYKDRLWPYGIVNYKIRDKAEFTSDELIYLAKVMEHIETETCIEFRNLDASGSENDKDSAESEADTAENDTITSPVMKKNGESHSDSSAASAAPLGSNASVVEKSYISTQPMPIKKLIPGVVPGATVSGSSGTKTVTGKAAAGISPLAGSSVIMKTVSPLVKSATVTASKAKVAESVKPKPKASRNTRRRSASRRHAANILSIGRTSEKGCKCPKPGRPEGNKILLINNDCFNSVNDLLHVFVHILGLDHQHNSHDRDSFLQIVQKTLTDDVKADLEHKLPPEASVGYPYDYQSIMHFPWLQIKDGKSNMIYPVWNDGWTMGSWEGLSATDVLKINRLYDKACTSRKEEAAPSH